MTDLIPVPFRGATLYLVDQDDTPYTPMKPIVEGMGLSWHGQFEKLNENKERWGIRVIRMPTEGGRQEMVCLPLRKLPGWLMSIQPSRVNPEIRETVIAYQNECDDVLWDYWTKGHVDNPRRSPSPDTNVVPFVGAITPAMQVELAVFQVASVSLRVSETSKQRMLTAICKQNGGNADFLPSYSTNESLTKSMTDLLKDHGATISRNVALAAMKDLGLLEVLTRRSTSSKTGTASFNSLTADGLKYGRNETSKQNPNETQVRLYVDRFPELLDVILGYLKKEDAA